MGGRKAEKEALHDIREIYSKIKPEIEIRLAEFKDVWENGSEEDVFAELVFCLFTPQSKAKSCWATLLKLREEGLLLEGGEQEVLRECNLVRFKYKKSGFVVEARQHFVKGGEVSIRPLLASFGKPPEMRNWLVENIKGLGYKEASHFLRNVGRGEELAILDRHILKNLVLLGVIKEIPKSLTPTRYLGIEKKMLVFCKKSNIPMDHLDLVLWYKEAGEVFK